MRIHTDKVAEVASAIYNTTFNSLTGVYANIRRHGSRSRDGAVELRLEGNGYARNTGQYGADGYEQGATWDEWGVVLAAIFDTDPNAFAGSAKYPVYAGAGHFHAITCNRFTPEGLPGDTHKRHNWRGGYPRTCTKCSAAIDRSAGEHYLGFWK